jgi:HPt (histidine-containing phosphotransfer) domain-containing protein
VVGRLAGWFLADAEGQLRSMRRALHRGDLESLAFAAHTLAGSSATVGAGDLSRLADLVSAPEAPEAQIDWLAVARALAAMGRELDLVREAFDAWALTL